MSIYSERCDPRLPQPCLGLQLKARSVDNSHCVEGFVAGQPHLTNKFCHNCSVEGFAVPASRVRTLAAHARLRFKNTNTEGFWCRGVPTMPPFRIINQHKRCAGVPLILFAEDPPESADWHPPPAEYVTPEGLMRLRVAYATIIPARKYHTLAAKGGWDAVLAAPSSSTSEAVSSSVSYTSASPPPELGEGQTRLPSHMPPAGKSGSLSPSPSFEPLRPCLAPTLTPTPTACGADHAALISVSLPEIAESVQSQARSPEAAIEDDGILDLDMHFPIGADLPLPSPTLPSGTVSRACMAPGGPIAADAGGVEGTQDGEQRAKEGGEAADADGALPKRARTAAAPFDALNTLNTLATAETAETAGSAGSVGTFRAVSVRSAAGSVSSANSMRASYGSPSSLHGASSEEGVSPGAELGEAVAGTAGEGGTMCEQLGQPRDPPVAVPLASALASSLASTLALPLPAPRPLALAWPRGPVPAAAEPLAALEASFSQPRELGTWQDAGGPGEESGWHSVASEEITPALAALSAAVDGGDGGGGGLECKYVEEAEGEDLLPRPCMTCRKRRTLCDRRKPCSRCMRLGVECTLPPTVKRGRPSAADQLAKIEEFIEQTTQQPADAELLPPPPTMLGLAAPLPIAMVMELAVPCPSMLTMPALSPPSSPPEENTSLDTTPPQADSPAPPQADSPTPPQAGVVRRLTSPRLVAGLSLVCACMLLVVNFNLTLTPHAPSQPAAVGVHTRAPVYLRTSATDVAMGANASATTDSPPALTKPLPSPGAYRSSWLHSVVLHSSIPLTLSLLAAFLPRGIPAWLTPYMHVVNVGNVAMRVQSAAARAAQIEGFDECESALAVRRVILGASVLGTIGRAAMVSYSRGALFWWANRAVALYQGMLLALSIGVLWLVEDPPLYPPSDEPLAESLLMTALLLSVAGIFTPSFRGRIASTVRPYLKYAAMLPGGLGLPACVVDAADGPVREAGVAASGTAEISRVRAEFPEAAVL